MKRTSLWWSLLGALATAACGSSDTGTRHIGDGSSGGQPSGGAANGGMSSGGKPNGGAPPGGSANGGMSGGGGALAMGGGGAATACKIAPPAGGTPLGATVIGGVAHPDAISTRCDGSFALSGDTLTSIYFERPDGTEIGLTDAPLWVAAYGADAAVQWARAVVIGDGQSTASRVLALADGSVILYGNYGESAIFDPGGPHETNLPEGDWRPGAFAARYGSDGTLKWARRFAKADSYGLSAAPAPNGGVYLAIDVTASGPDAVSDGTHGIAVGEDGVGLIEVDADGNLKRGVSFAPLAGLAGIELAPLQNGGLTAVGSTAADPATITDATHSTVVPPKTYFMARFDANLALISVDKLVDSTDDVRFLMFAGLPDGSLVAYSDTATHTLGHGDPTQQTFSPAMNDEAGLLAHYDARGHLKWARQIEARGGTLVSLAMGAFPDGGIWLGGDYFPRDVPLPKDQVVLGFDSADALTIQGAGLHSFVARFGGDGKPAWGYPFLGSTNFEPNRFGISGWPGGVMVAGTTGAGFTFAGASPKILSQVDVAVLKFGP